MEGMGLPTPYQETSSGTSGTDCAHCDVFIFLRLLTFYLLTYTDVTAFIFCDPTLYDPAKFQMIARKLVTRNDQRTYNDPKS